MNRFDVGTHLWVSRFSPHVFTKFKYDMVNGEWICAPEQIDIFQPPTRYVVTYAYPENENSKKWVVELAVADSDEPNDTDDDSTMVAAPLSDIAPVLKCELNLNMIHGGVFNTHDDLIVTKKRSKNLQTITRKLTGMLKQFKAERKYKDMAIVSYCLAEIKTESQLAQMVEKHPEYFV